MTGTLPSGRTAQEWITKIEHEMFNQKYFPERVGHDHTLAEAIDRYIERVLPTKSAGSQEKQLQILKWWKRALGDKLLSQLTPEHFEEQKHHLWQEKKFSEYTVNVYLATISHVMTVCSSPSWNWMPHNPMRHVKKLREKRDRLPSVTPYQLNQLLFWCDNSNSKYLSLFVRLAVATGGRKREILGLKWSQIDLKERRITFENTKNKERRSVPIDEGTTYLLQTYYDEIFTDDNWGFKFPEYTYVFVNEKTGKPIGDLCRTFHRARRKAMLPDLRIHDLRHLYASWLAEKGKADLGTIADLLGHKNIQMTRRYRHLTENHTAEIVQRMATAVFQ